MSSLQPDNPDRDHKRQEHGSGEAQHTDIIWKDEISPALRLLVSKEPVHWPVTDVQTLRAHLASLSTLQLDQPVTVSTDSPYGGTIQLSGCIEAFIPEQRDNLTHRLVAQVRLDEPYSTEQFSESSIVVPLDKLEPRSSGRD